MQTDILIFFKSIATPFLDHAAEAVTMLGEPGFYVFIIALIFWGISKKAGITITFALLLSAFLNSLIKITLKAPRPFEVLPELQGKRLETATGYSFPSGHTQGASTFYTALTLLFNNRILRFFCMAAIVMIGVSRIYLGVHWPIDVLGGWIFGIGLAWFLTGVVRKKWEDHAAMQSLLLLSLLVVACITIYMTGLELFLYKGDVKTQDFFKNSGLLMGCFGGFLLELKLFDFDASKGSIPQKVIRILIGYAGIILFQGGLKILFPDYFILHLLRYGIIGIWITLILPLGGRKTGLFYK